MMSAQSPSPAPITLLSDVDRGVERRTIELEVITPLFGGGVHVSGDDNTRQQKRPDPVTPVRGAAIRGQLRFWWRATRGGQCADLDEMRALEAALWGAASHPARVDVVVRGRLSTRREPVFEMRESRSGKWNPRPLRGMSAVAYAAFPLQPPGSKPMKLEPGDLHWVRGQATVELRFDARPPRKGEPTFDPTQEWAAIERAVDAWLAFGGLGGRTRRGFGAVGDGATLDPAAALTTLSAHSGQNVAGTPSLAGARLVTLPGTYTDPLPALSAGIERLQTFRQGQGTGRNKGREANRPGRSRWPEAELIRSHTGQSAPEHAKRLVGVDKTPRAAFGLPIIFHFKDGSDPGDSTLTPVGAERRASPLILRPYRHSADRYGVLALALNDGASDALPLSLKPKNHPARDVSADLTPDEARKIRPLGGETDVIGAFLDFFSTPARGR